VWIVATTHQNMVVQNAVYAIYMYTDRPPTLFISHTMSRSLTGCTNGLDRAKCAVSDRPKCALCRVTKRQQHGRFDLQPVNHPHSAFISFLPSRYVRDRCSIRRAPFAVVAQRLRRQRRRPADDACDDDDVHG